MKSVHWVIGKTILFLLPMILFMALPYTAAAGNDLNSEKEMLLKKWISELKLGVRINDVGHLWSGFSEESGAIVHGEIVINCNLTEVLGGIARPALGVSINTGGDTGKIFAGFLWERFLSERFFLNLGAGCAVHSGTLEADESNRKGLGSRWLFRIPVEIGYILNRNHRLYLGFDHISNAGLARPNEGLDTLGIGYGYRF